MNFKKMVLAAVAMVFAFSAHSGELVKKKDSFAEAAPPDFAMAHAVEGQTCHRSGDIGMSTDGLILSCQSGAWAAALPLWVNIPLTDTKLYDLRCNYRIEYIETYTLWGLEVGRTYPSVVLPKHLMIGVTQISVSWLPHHNKTTLYKGDPPTKSYVVTKLEKQCPHSL